MQNQGNSHLCPSHRMLEKAVFAIRPVTEERSGERKAVSRVDLVAEDRCWTRKPVSQLSLVAEAMPISQTVSTIAGALHTLTTFTARHPTCAARSFSRASALATVMVKTRVHLAGF